METNNFWCRGGFANLARLTSQPYPRPSKLVLPITSRCKKSEIDTAAGGAVPAARAHRDSWFARLAVHHLSHSVQAATGMKCESKGYDGLVETACMLGRNYTPEKQRELVARALSKAIPEFILSLVRVLLPQTKFTRELFAAFTALFFTWLVGPCEVRESELLEGREKNVVHVKKCRFLEETNCVGMCTNLCKLPSQKFIKDSLGMPITMTPNFEDMSCEMIFGQNPPEAHEDPALKQPCHQILCKANQKKFVGCSSTR